MLLKIPRLTPHVFRHAGALARLAAADSKTALERYRRFAVRIAIAGSFGLLGALLGCAWILAAVWDTPYRVPTAGVLTGVALLVALVAFLSARSAVGGEAPFAATRRQIEQDRELYAALRPEEASEPPPDVRPAEEQLEDSREQIRRVAERSQAADTTLRFPRSRTMQLLTRGATGAGS